MNITGPKQVFTATGLSSSTAANTGMRLGDIGYDALGRRYRWVKAGAVALVVGNVIQAPAMVANHIDLTPVAASIGDEYIDVALGATAATENQYAFGQAIISTTPGLGYGYGISGHKAADASATLRLNMFKSDKVQVALTTSSRVYLMPNPYNGVIQAPVTTLTGAIVGVCVYPIGIGEYGWIGVGGVFPVLIAGTPAVGQALSSPSSAAGAAAINSSTLTIIGTAQVVGVDGKVLPVLVNLP